METCTTLAIYEEPALPELAFSDVQGEDWGPGKRRYLLRWGEFELTRLIFEPENGVAFRPVWAIGKTKIEDKTMLRFLERKWRVEMAGKIILLRKVPAVDKLCKED